MRLIALVTHTGRRGEKGGEKNKQTEKKYIVKVFSFEQFTLVFLSFMFCKQKMTQLVFFSPFFKSNSQQCESDLVEKEN